jgi:methylsterol monooxygenase
MAHHFQFGDDEYNLCVYGTFLVTNSMYWTVGSLYSYLDISETPTFLSKYKIQPQTNEPVEWKRFVQLIKQVCTVANT